MSAVTVVVRCDSGARASVAATLDTPSAGLRLGKGLAVALGGLLFAAASALVPGPHLALTLPGGVLGGVAGFWLVWRVRERLPALDLACPACGQDVRLEGGRVHARMVEPCPACNRPLQLIVERAEG